jgi:exopolyphosphatase/guanosine-5'-triphosphate,3'-diphosphate pyrophosphatase
MGIAIRNDGGLPQLIRRYREPVRLGHDAFTAGVLSPQTINHALHAFRKFRLILDQYHARKYRAVATSAVRDSGNGHELAKRLYDETGIKLELISGEEEARLVHYSISHRFNLSGMLTLLIDMGGGSVEVTVCDNGRVVSTQSFKIGTVRLLEILGKQGHFNILLSEYLDGIRKKLTEQIGGLKPDLCLGTGGNATAIGELAYRFLGTESADRITCKQLEKLIKRLSRFSMEERIRHLGLRPDRADVILPAAVVFHEIMQLAGGKRMVMPDASLLDGVILDMLETEQHTFKSQRLNLLAWAHSLKKKYHVDDNHAQQVAMLALRLFDQTVALHGLDHRMRLLLELAALVHEIGMYVRVGGHHRHASYLISVAPLLDLSPREKTLLAQVVRYQRKAPPDESHKLYAALDKRDQKTVWQLSALLRLALALNKERRNLVRDVRVITEKKEMHLQIQGDGDLLLERWAVLKNSNYVQQAFQRRIHIEFDSSCKMFNEY